MSSEHICAKSSFETTCAVCGVVPFRTCPLEKLKSALRAWKCWTPAANCLLRLKTLSRQVVYCEEAHFMHHFRKCSIMLFCGHGELEFWVFPLGYCGPSPPRIHFCHYMLFKDERLSLNLAFRKVFVHELLKTDGLKSCTKQISFGTVALSLGLGIWAQSSYCVFHTATSNISV